MMACRMPSVGVAVNPTQVDIPKSKAYAGRISGVTSSNVTADVDGWDGMTLEYTIDWSLHLFFTQELLSK